MCSSRYLLASSDRALFVGLIGTKYGRDLFTDVNFLQRGWDGANRTNGLVSVQLGIPYRTTAFLPNMHLTCTARTVHKAY